MVCKRKEPQSYKEETMAFFNQIKTNLLVNPDNTKNIPLHAIEIPYQGTVVNL